MKNLLPLRVVALIRYLRRMASFPRMEVNGLSPERVRALLADLGAPVVDAVDDRVHGADTPGFRYCAVKRAGSTAALL